MNVSRVQFPQLPSSPGLRPVGSRLDVTSSAPAAPGQLGPVQPPDTTTQVGTIPGVLTEAENRAIATLFKGTVGSIYTGDGATQQRQAMPGQRIDFTA